VLTANHISNSILFVPNEGYANCNVWLLRRNKNEVIRIEKSYLKTFPEIDACIISLPKPTSYNACFAFEKDKFHKNDLVENFGHLASEFPGDLTFSVKFNSLEIDDYDLSSVYTDGQGEIDSIFQCSIETNDLRIEKRYLIQPSFKANIGMSGGPLILQGTNKLVGLMSFGLPPDSRYKETVYAIHVDEIMKEFSNVQL
jgi:hypothetical protein